MIGSLDELLTQGRRELVCGEVTKAVETFQSVCEQLAKEHGDLHDSLAEPNLLYGSALLELVRMESGVLGNALEGVPEEDNSSENDDFIDQDQSMTDAEKEEVSDQVIDAMCVTEEEKNDSIAKDDKISLEKSESEEPEPTDKEKSPKPTDKEKSPKLTDKEKSPKPADTEKSPKPADEEKSPKPADKEKSPKPADKEKSKLADKEKSPKPTEDSDAPKDDIHEKTHDKPQEDASPKSKDDADVDVAEPVPCEGDDVEEDEEKGSDGDESSKEDEVSGENQDADAGDSQGEEISNLQLAWECIEVAKQIFAKSDSKENQLKVADCLEKLAEISREKEDYEKSVEDLEECLSLRLKHLEKNDRVVAETYYQTGTTHAVSGKLDNACDSFKSALSCLKSLRSETESKLKALSADSSSKKDSLEETIKDLNDLIPDIEQRIIEVDEDRIEEKMAVQAKENTESTVAQCSSTTTDISHLVRKKTKRPIQDTEAKEESASVTTNGHNGLGEGDKSHSKAEPLSKKVKLDEALVDGNQKDDLPSTAEVPAINT